MLLAVTVGLVCTARCTPRRRPSSPSCSRPACATPEPRSAPSSRRWRQAPRRRSSPRRCSRTTAARPRSRCTSSRRRCSPSSRWPVRRRPGTRDLADGRRRRSRGEPRRTARPATAQPPRRPRQRRGSASRRQPVQPQRELDLQRAFRALPVVAQQPGHPLQPLGDGVHVDVQRVLGAGRAHPAGEVRVEGAHQFGAAPRVVVERPAPRVRRRSRRRRGSSASSRPRKPKSSAAAPSPARPSRRSASTQRRASA